MNEVQLLYKLTDCFSRMSKIVAKVATVVIENIGKHGKELAKILDERIDAILDALVAFNREATSSLCQLADPSAAKDQIITAIEDACVFVGSIDDLLYHGKETDFESIKDDIRKGSNKKLNWFLHKMNKWLENTKQPYDDFTGKCSTASKYFTEGAENFAFLQAQERASKKKVRIVGGTASAAVFSGALSIVGVAASTGLGFLTLGVGAVVGLSITAAGLGVAGVTTSVVTHISAREHNRTEESLKAMGTTFRELAQHGAGLRHGFDDLHATLKRHDQNFKFIRNTDRDDQDTLCCALDHVKYMLQTQHFDISKARETLLTLKNKILQESRK